MIIQNGKTLKIKLKGKSLSSAQGKIVLKSSTFELPTLPTGLCLPVALPIGLQNIGTNSLKYSVDKHKFNADYEYECEQGVIDFENADGTVAANEKKFFLVFYKPNEQRNYRFRFQIRVSDYFREVQTVDIDLTGSATHQSENFGNFDFFKVGDRIETHQTLMNENENLAYVSEKLIDFRNIDLGKIHQRVFFIFNNSATDSLDFQFLNFNITRLL